MASSTLTLYRDNTNTTAFALVSTSDGSARWISSGRALATPFQVSQRIKVSKGAGNDEVYFTVSRTEANASTGKLATALAEIRVSIPKDQTILTPTLQKELLALCASAINDAAALGATLANRTALIEGRII